MQKSRIRAGLVQTMPLQLGTRDLLQGGHQEVQAQVAQEVQAQAQAQAVQAQAAQVAQEVQVAQVVQEGQAQAVQAQVVQSQAVQAQVVQAQGVQAQAAQEVQAQAVQAQVVQAQEVQAQEVQALEGQALVVQAQAQAQIIPKAQDPVQIQTLQLHPPALTRTLLLLRTLQCSPVQAHQMDQAKMSPHLLNSQMNQCHQRRHQMRKNQWRHRNLTIQWNPRHRPKRKSPRLPRKRKSQLHLQKKRSLPHHQKKKNPWGLVLDLDLVPGLVPGRHRNFECFIDRLYVVDKTSDFPF